MFAASTGSAAQRSINWKAKYGGLSVSEAKRLRALERENARLKKLFADAMLDNAMLKSCCQKNGVARRQARGW
jgi:putative transposase